MIIWIYLRCAFSFPFYYSLCSNKHSNWVTVLNLWTRYVAKNIFRCQFSVSRADSSRVSLRIIYANNFFRSFEKYMLKNILAAHLPRNVCLPIKYFKHFQIQPQKCWKHMKAGMTKTIQASLIFSLTALLTVSRAWKAYFKPKSLLFMSL